MTVFPSYSEAPKKQSQYKTLYRKTEFGLFETIYT